MTGGDRYQDRICSDDSRHRYWYYAPSPSGPEFITALGETTPMHRASQPEEIAEVVAFLLSPRASCMTGATVAADGGRRAIGSGGEPSSTMANRPTR
jgi:NAD(P)-dependent dehydrogenase (short-subunit alcohol dehydrogenase family)